MYPHSHPSIAPASEPASTNVRIFVGDGRGRGSVAGTPARGPQVEQYRIEERRTWMSSSSLPSVPTRAEADVGRIGRIQARFANELARRKRSAKTIDAYLSAVAGVCAHFQRPADQLSDSELQAYLLHLASARRLSANSRNLAVTGLRQFFALVAGWPEDRLRQVLPRVSAPAAPARTFTKAEIQRLVEVGCVHARDRAFLLTVYGAGLRLGEACRLRTSDLDTDRMVIRVESSPGSRSRCTVLSSELLQELCRYWKACQPEEWLFPVDGDRRRPMGEFTGQRIFAEATRRAGLPRNGGISSLRESFARHQLEAGVPLAVVQAQLGHERRATTSGYLRRAAAPAPLVPLPAAS